MTENMKRFVDIITADINSKFGDDLPSLEDINTSADRMRSALGVIYPITDEEFSFVKKTLASNILHSIGTAITLRGKDSEHKTWYFIHKNDGYYWNRYKTYLKDVKHWGTEVVNRLNETTNDIMDDLGDPNDRQRPFQRRGLLLGDVQSGKTATYTAICTKAADAGYKVIIVLAGLMENLRIQTQGRLDTEFVGIDSKFALDKTADQEIRRTPVGVGKIPPRNQNKRIACFTSVSTDFNRSTLRSLGLSLRSLNDTALFVVKKNKSVLNNLYKWLMNNNADYTNGMIDLPLLLIDDEADNASVNTNSEEKDPTAINAAIRNILSCFRQASYLGITATPFANIFIDPDLKDDDSTRDLFPKDFLTVLPTPEGYIGTDLIFGNGDADDWSEDGVSPRTEGKYNSALVPIENEEQASFYYFKHKKTLAEDLYDIPNSMKEAIRYFILVTAVTDLRKDNTEHRSMLVNVSRFTLVQNATADIIQAYVADLRADIENYSQIAISDAMKIKNIAALADTWNKYGLGVISGAHWETILRDYLFNAARRIEVRSVNQQNGAASLDYTEYKNIGMRVIAVGGNSLSRGLTLEGLCVSYFYRNTMMYDTLLQMGRWFGYRPNYNDLFKIWMGEDSIDWYGYITDAINELKEELRKMKRANLTPEDFGLKVRQAPGALLITAKNKMRTGTLISQPITVSGRMIETPRLLGDSESVSANEQTCRTFLRKIDSDPAVECIGGYDSSKPVIWKNVPKAYVVDLVKSFKTHPWNLNFQPTALANYIAEEDDHLNMWDVAIPNGKETYWDQIIQLDNREIHIYPEARQLEWDSETKNMLKVSGHHVRVGTGGCTKIGLDDETIKRLRDETRNDPNGKITDRTYLIKDRPPLLLIHILHNTSKAPDRREGDPEILFALGLGFPNDGRDRRASYVVNTTELKNWVDVPDEVEDDGD